MGEAYDLAAERAWEERLRRRPRCACCGELVDTEEYVELAPFGGVGIGCGRCRDRFSRWADRLDREEE